MNKDENAPNLIRPPLTEFLSNEMESGASINISQQSAAIAGVPQCSAQCNEDKCSETISNNTPSEVITKVVEYTSSLPLQLPLKSETYLAAANLVQGVTEQPQCKPQSKPRGTKDDNNSSSKASPSKKSVTPVFVYDPNKVPVKFIFANRDGINVLLEFVAENTVGEVKEALMQSWPSDFSPRPEVDAIRLICMGRGVLMPDSRTLKDCGVPTFETHATPVNVSVRPGEPVNSSIATVEEKKSGTFVPASRGGESSVTQGCACILL